MSVLHVERAEGNYIPLKVNNKLYIFGSNKNTNNHTIAQSTTEKQMFLSEHAL